MSATVSCVPYEGRVISLTAEQLRYENGQSYVAWRVSSQGGAASYYGIGPIAAYVDGNLVYSKGISYYSGGSAAFPVAVGSVSGSLWIAHSGSKTITISLSAYVYMDLGEGPFTATLTLPAGESAGGWEGEYAATPILLVTGGDIGSKCTVAFAPDWEGYHYRISYVLGQTTYAWDFHPQSSGKLVEAQIPLVYDLAQGLDRSGTVLIRLGTYRDATMNPTAQVGKNSTWNLEIQVVEDSQTRPRITALDLTPSPDVLSGAWLQNKTGVLGAVTAQGQYGAAITAAWFRVEGRSYESGQTSSLLAGYGPLTVTAYATDSRGFTSEGFSLTLEVLAYSIPRLRPIEGQSRVTAFRCDGEGNPQEEGAWVTVKVRREYSPLMAEGVRQNFCPLSFRYKPDTGSTWSAWEELLSGEAEEDSLTTPPLLGTLAPKSAYNLELRALDTLGSQAAMVLTLYSGSIYLHRHGALGSLGFGKYAEEPDLIDVADHKTVRLRGALDLRGEAYALVLDLCHPVGSLLESTREEDPGQYLGGTWELQDQTQSTTKWRRIQ